MNKTNKGKHLYILAGALMMLILAVAVGTFHRNVMADINDPEISAEDARKAALTDAGVNVEEVTFTKTKLDNDEGLPVFDVEFYTDTRDYEYEINGLTGEVKEKDVSVHKKIVMENTQPAEEPVKTGTEELIGVAKAQEAALEAAGLTADQVEFNRTSLDTEDGRKIYEVSFFQENQEYEIEVDAYSGTVLKEQIDIREAEYDPDDADDFDDIDDIDDDDDIDDIDDDDNDDDYAAALNRKDSGSSSSEAVKKTSDKKVRVDDDDDDDDDRYEKDDDDDDDDDDDRYEKDDDDDDDD